MTNNRMRIIFTTLIFIMGVYCLGQAQNLEEYQQVDKFKVSGLTAKVYFNDPLKKLLKKYPDFDNKDNQTKQELLSDFLHNNPLYVFETYKKKKLKKAYWLVGDPRKVRTKNYFNLEIRNPDNSIEKIVNQINVGGSFFEHMMIFQTPQGKRSVGKGVQIWGYFTMVQPYSSVKSSIVALVEKDITNSIPEEVLAEKKEKIEPLFEYQKCGLENVDQREFTINVYQYDSLGNVKNKYPRKENDNQLYYSSTSKELIGVTTFPFFSIDDEKMVTDSVIFVNTELENINHYLRDIRIINNAKGAIERIEAKLIIHGYSAQGHSTHEELYLLEFSDIGICRLPKSVKFSPLDDKDFKRPRLTIDINYELK